MLYFANKLSEEDYETFNCTNICAIDNQKIHSQVKSKTFIFDDIAISNLTTFSRHSKKWRSEFKYELHFFDFSVKTTSCDTKLDKKQQFLLDYDWQKYLYSKLTKEDKVKYLDDLKKYLKSTNMGDKDIKNYTKEIELNIPYHSIDFYNAHKKDFEELQNNEINNLLNMQSRRNELLHAFEEFEFNPEKPIKKQVMPHITLSNKNIEKLQKKYIILSNMTSDYYLDKYLSYLVVTYLNCSRGEILKNHKDMTEQEIKAKMQPYKLNAELMIDKIIRYPIKMEEKLFNQYKEYLMINENLNKNQDTLNKYHDLQFSFINNSPTQENYEVLDLAKKIENDTNARNIKPVEII